MYPWPTDNGSSHSIREAPQQRASHETTADQGCREPAIMWCPAPGGPSTTPLLHLRPREYLGRRVGRIVRARTGWHCENVSPTRHREATSMRSQTQGSYICAVSPTQLCNQELNKDGTQSQVIRKGKITQDPKPGQQTPSNWVMLRVGEISLS